MAASLSGTKTCTVGVAPHLSAAAISALLAIALEDMTVASFGKL